MGYSPEYASLESDPTYLAGLAEAGGGAVLTEPAEAIAHNIRGIGVRRDLWPYLLASTVLLLPFDVGVRRLALGRRDFVRIWEWVLARLPGRRRPAAEAPSPVGRLFQAKARTKAGRSDGEIVPPKAITPAPVEQPMEASSILRQAQDRPLPRGVGEEASAQPGQVGADGETLAERLLRRRRGREEEE